MVEAAASPASYQRQKLKVVAAVAGCCYMKMPSPIASDRYNVCSTLFETTVEPDRAFNSRP
jgi:hypothetical protein